MNMMRNIKYLVLGISVAAIGGFMACETTEQIDDFPIIKPQIVLNCLISPDSNWEFQVSKSLSVLDNANTDFLNTAKIDVSENGNKLFSPSGFNSRGFFYYSAQKPVSGHTYQLDVDVDKMTAVHASCTIPDRVNIETVKGTIKDSNTWYDPWLKKGYGELKGDMTIRFSDPDSTDNFYLLTIYTIDTYEYVLPPYDTVREIYRDYYVGENDENPVIDIASDQYYIFSDDLFNGQTFDFFIPFHDWSYYSFKTYVIALYSVDRNMYLYYRSKALYDNRRENPFAEPVQVYTNIENGFGVFGAYVADVTTFRY